MTPIVSSRFQHVNSVHLIILSRTINECRKELFLPNDLRVEAPDQSTRFRFPVAQALKTKNRSSALHNSLIMLSALQDLRICQWSPVKSERDTVTTLTTQRQNAT